MPKNASITDLVVKEKIRELISKTTNIEIKKIHENINFVEELGFDSVKMIQIITAIEDRFSIQFDDDLLDMNEFGNFNSLLKNVVQIINGIIHD